MKYLFLTIAFFTFVLSAQTGPGGIGSTNTNQFWLDANKLSLLNGAGVSSFIDVSGNSNDFNQSSSIAQPIFTANAINGLPVLRFDGSNDDLLSNSIPAIESNHLTWFVVYKMPTLSRGALIGGNYDSHYNHFQTYTNDNDARIITSQFSTGSIQYVRYTDDIGSYTISSSHISPTNMSVYKNGALQMSSAKTHAAPSGHNFVTLGSFPSADSYFLNGDIAEVVCYNVALNNLERVIVENYLGAKYNRTIQEDYFSYQNTHNFGVIGIGNDGVNSHSDSKGNDVVQISNPTALSSNEYLFVGHNGIDLLTYTTTDLPATSTADTRWSRTWRIDETGSVGVTTLTFDMSGTNGFGIPGSHYLLIDDDGDFSNATVVSGVYDSGNETFSVDVDLVSGQYFTVSGELDPPVAVHSIVTGNWNSPTTWDCNCIPTVLDTVYIEPTHTVSVDVDAYTYDLYVETGGVLKMDADFDLNISGDFLIDGELDFTNGQLAMVGNVGQFIIGNGNTINLNEVLIQNSNTSNVFFFNGEFVLNNTLHPNNGVMVVISGTKFIVNSTSATTTGRIGKMLSSFSIQGQVTVKRFLPAGVAGNRLISSPVIGANLSEWDNDIEISGTGFPDGCAYSSDGCYFSCKRYNGGDFSGSYIDITDPNEPLSNGTGYEIFIGDDLNVFSGATLSSTGTLRDKNNFSIVSPQIMPGWNIMGNPYASPISFNSIVASHIGDYFYVYDAVTGGYQWYDGASNTSSIPELNDGKLAIGQGFFVYGGGVPSIDFEQSQKTSSTATFIRNQEINQSIGLELTQEGTTFMSCINVDYNTAALDGHDSLDMPAFTIGKQEASSIYIDADTELLTKNYLSTDGRDKVQDLSIKILNDGYFTITAANLSNVYNYTNITLVDLATGDIIDLRKSNYTFYAMEDDETRTRFQLILSNESLGNETNSGFGISTNDELSITQIGKAIDINSNQVIEGVSQVLLTNLLGQNVLYTENIQIQQGVNMMYLPKELTGVYLVTVKTSNGVITKKIIL